MRKKFIWCENLQKTESFLLHCQKWLDLSTSISNISNCSPVSYWQPLCFASRTQKFSPPIPIQQRSQVCQMCMTTPLWFTFCYWLLNYLFRYLWIFVVVFSGGKRCELLYCFFYVPLCRPVQCALRRLSCWPSVPSETTVFFWKKYFCRKISFHFSNPSFLTPLSLPPLPVLFFHFSFPFWKVFLLKKILGKWLRKSECRKVVCGKPRAFLVILWLVTR